MLTLTAHTQQSHHPLQAKGPIVIANEAHKATFDNRIIYTYVTLKQAKPQDQELLGTC